MTIPSYFLHGFLGRPSDWDGLSPVGAVAIDLFADPIPVADTPAAWAERFTARVAAEVRGPVTLVGYSLGARLALHALVARPGLWKRAVLVSCHPGLEVPAERAARLVDDEAWARRFVEEPWEEVIAAWEGRDVFGGAAPPAARRERDFPRERIAAALVRWSLGRQKNLLPALPSTSVPITWMAGRKDVKFTALAERGAEASGGECVIVENAGHRVPWERPKEFVRIIRRDADGGKR